MSQATHTNSDLPVLAISGFGLATQGGLPETQARTDLSDLFHPEHRDVSARDYRRPGLTDTNPRGTHLKVPIPEHLIVAAATSSIGTPLEDNAGVIFGRATVRSKQPV